jgi:hypothetical protein
MPRVSILMPCRDAAATLPAAIETIRAQTFPHFEVVAVDDGSQDHTFAHLFTWAQKDGRVRVLQGNRRGRVPALATALAAARGELVAIMEPGDVSDPTRVEKQVALLDAEPALAGCGTGVRHAAGDEVPDEERRRQTWLNSLSTPAEVGRDIFIDCPIPHATLMMRRHVLLGLGGYREMGWPEDYDLLFRAWSAGYRVGKLTEILHQRSLHADAAGNGAGPGHADRLRAVKIHFLRATLLAGGRDGVIWGAGPDGAHFARDLARAGTRIAAFIDSGPPASNRTIHGVAVVGPGSAREYAGHGSSAEALVVAVARSEDHRAEIRSACRGMGLVEGEDLVVVA